MQSVGSEVLTSQLLQDPRKRIAQTEVQDGHTNGEIVSPAGSSFVCQTV